MYNSISKISNDEIVINYHMNVYKMPYDMMM